MKQRFGKTKGMSKKLKILLGIIFLITLSILIYVYFENKNYYSIGESDIFNINVDETFTIKLYENGSTGFENRWINKNNCSSLILSKEEYEPELFSEKCVGCGGIKTLTFKGVASGLDTILISNCFFS